MGQQVELTYDVDWDFTCAIVGRGEVTSELEGMRRFEIAAHAASLGVWDWDLRTDTFFYSARAKEICGFDAERQLTFPDVVSVTHPDDLSRTSDLARRAIDPNICSTEPYRYRIRRADTGGVRWVLGHGEPVFAANDGTISTIRYIGTLQDITERRNAEQALIESEARLRFAIESGKMAVWEIDLDNDTITPSAELNALCGFPPDANPSLDDIRARYAPGEEKRIELETAELAASGATEFQTSFKQVWPNGTEKWLMLQAGVAPPNDAIAHRAVGVIADTTAQKLAERRRPRQLAASPTPRIKKLGRPRAVFSIYVQNWGNYSAAFGSVSAAVVLMLWMYNSAQILVLGAAFNALLERGTGPVAPTSVPAQTKPNPVTAR